MKVMNYFSKMLLILLLVVCFNSQTSAQVTQGTNGINVNYVEYPVSNGSTGYLKQVSAISWQESNSNGTGTNAFTETGRDEWSVYLNKSDGSKLQLDLHTSKVKYNGANLYNIARATSEVNGVNANYVGYSSGHFKQISNTGWQESNNDGIFTFTEKYRDGWSIYLNKSDGSEVVLNLHTQEVSYRGGYIYSITSATSETKGWTVTHVNFAPGPSNGTGSFRQVAAKTWVEYDLNGGIVHTLTETSRDEWSVKLKKSDGSEILLNLHRRKVLLNRADLYSISSSDHRPVVKDKNLIYLVGSGRALSEGELKSKVTMVQTGKLQTGECTIVYPNASAGSNNVKAELGVLMCAQKIGDNVTVSSTIIQGGCTAGVSMGAGGQCKVGVLQNKLEVEFDGGTIDLNVNGPSASACASASPELVCFSAGATLAETSFGVTDDNGNGVGMGVSVGVGYGLDTQYEDGVISGSLDLKLGVGASINYSVNAGQAVDGVATVGETGYVLVKHEVKAVGAAVNREFPNEVNVVTVAGEQAVGFTKNTAERVAGETVNFANNVSKTVRSWWPF